jgi:hypothetical protein
MCVVAPGIPGVVQQPGCADGCHNAVFASPGHWVAEGDCVWRIANDGSTAPHVTGWEPAKIFKRQVLVVSAGVKLSTRVAVSDIELDRGVSTDDIDTMMS